MFIKLIAPIILYQGQAVTSLENHTIFDNGDAVKLARHYSNTGADVLIIFDQSGKDGVSDCSLTLMKEIVGASDIPVWGAGNVRYAEDIKKILSAGCEKAILHYSEQISPDFPGEMYKFFGRDKIAMCVKSGEIESIPAELFAEIVKYTQDIVILSKDMADEECAENAFFDKMAKYSESFDAASPDLAGPITRLNVIIQSKDSPFVYNKDLVQRVFAGYKDIDTYLQTCSGNKTAAGLFKSCTGPKADAIGGAFTQDPNADIMWMKAQLKAGGYDVSLPASTLSWEDLKIDKGGLIPVVVQDYQNNEILMVAYMNRESYEWTISTGMMTYWSRSRMELWMKGLINGNRQYLKELKIDCDNDTLLARVMQIGPACHTGNRSCFYRTVLKKDAPGIS